MINTVYNDGMFSPLRRGWSLLHSNAGGFQTVLPAQAGMVQGVGIEPHSAGLFSPLRRGWSQLVLHGVTD